MTSSLGVEVTAGRFRTLAVAGDPGRRAPRRAARRCASATGRPVAELLGERVLDGRGWRGARPPRGPRAGRAHRPFGRDWRGGSPMRCGARRVQGSLLGGNDGTDIDRPAVRRGPSPPRRTSPMTCTGSGPDRRRGGLGRRHQAQPAPAPLPIDIGPALASLLWGEVTAVMTSATIPPRLVERVGLAGFDTEELDVGSRFDYRAHSLLYVAGICPIACAGADEALHEELALRWTRPAVGRSPCSRAAGPPRPRPRWRRIFFAYTLLLPGRPAQGPPARGVRHTTESACLFAAVGLLAGRWTSRAAALSLVTLDQAALSPAGRPARRR